VGRTLDEIDRPQLVVCSVDTDKAKALDGARWLLTQYIAQQPHITKASNTPEETVKKIQSILGWPATKEQIKEAMKLVPDELVQRITASGRPEEVKAKVREYVANGCTCPILYPLGDPYLMIEVFSDGYSE
jgi:5,10-methylenetetrahydromethanopterin reductase